MQFAIPNLRHLRVFLEVARHRSISKAAPRVFLSQPAITQAIGKLETLLEKAEATTLLKQVDQTQAAPKEAQRSKLRVTRA